MDSTYRPKSHDKSNIALPLSQSQPDEHKEITPENSSKSQCVTNSRRRSKHREDSNNVNDHRRKIKSLNQSLLYHRYM